VRLTLLLPVTIQIPGVAQLHVCALEVVSEDLKILPAVNRVPGQVIEPGPGRVIQMNG
jgi:hypothetical protein